MTAAVEVRGVTAFLEGPSGLRRVLDRVGLRVPEGGAFALLGESGSGKTLLLHSVLGLHPGVPGVVAGDASLLGVDVFGGLGGHVEFQDGPGLSIRKDVAGWNRGLRRSVAGLLGRAVTLVPQDPLTTLPPFYPVGQLLEAALRSGRPGLTRAEAARLALGWLGRVHMYGVDEVARLYPHELSGGMAQRVALALALAPGPRLLVADEPTTGLDATLRVRILELLASAVDQGGATLLLVTHDMEAARLLARDAAILCAGRIVEAGPVAVVLSPAAAGHPYSRFLLDAERRLGEGAPDEGEEVPLGPLAAGGCGYRCRCARAAARCESEAPELVEWEPGHLVACWEAQRPGGPP
ncbi:MAG: ABC transporter ATP-binding protein [Deltaproteobacteria bacterium]|nr:ABC transporter ATP-binding protein [Deltaproteobacteria bacterium]